jgi:phage/plasmid-like protein (TIGR03299 family)
MAHNITDTDGAVFHKVAAWHGLGLIVEDAMSPTEAMQIAGLDWEVNKVGPVFAGNPLTNAPSSDDYVAIVRSDNNKILSIQSPDYQPIQNSEVFEMAYNLGADIKVESALSMNGGRRLVVLCKTDTMDGVNSNDPIEKYMAFINSHDGTLAHSAMPTSVRIVCQNTLSMAMASGAKKAFRIVHSGDMKKKQEAMAEALKFYTKTGKLFEEKVSTLVRKELTKADIQKFWIDVWGILETPVDANPQTEAEYTNYLKATTTVAKWADIFDKEMRELNCGANLWLASNAVTKELQHRIPARGKKPTFESNAYSNLMGKNQDSTIDVMRYALTLA